MPMVLSVWFCVGPSKQAICSSVIIDGLQAASCLNDLDVFVALAVGPVVLAPVGVVTTGQRSVTIRCTHAEPSPYPRLRWQLAQLFLHQ